jgi:hypothetical protein
MKTITFSFLLMFVLTTAFAQRNVKIITSHSYNPGSGLINGVLLNGNNISSEFKNTGIFDRSSSGSNVPGFEWPKGSGRYAIFTAGLCIACGINGQYAQVMASYTGEYAPGKIVNGVFYTDSTFKMYSVKAGDSAANNPDYANWYRMVPYGAPYDDVNNNGIYDDGIDKPGIKNASQTLFEVMTDCDVSQHNSGEGFGGGITSPLLLAEVAWTSWAYTYSGFEDVQFLRWRIINKGNNTWDSTFMGIVSDPDLGDPNDDLIGCDTTLDLGFCYNADNNDGTGAPPTYGIAPPAVGIHLFQGAIKKNSGSQSDTLGMTSFCYFSEASGTTPPCESMPYGEPIGAYHMLQGLKKDRTPFMDITQTPPRRTKFCYAGNGNGWTESNGSMNNCNGDTTGSIVFTGGDKRFVLGTGRVDLRVFPNDTQTIIIGQMIARGTNNFNSVTRLKSLSGLSQIFYASNFSVPVINITTEVPGKYSLMQNYPNPFNPMTNVNFSIINSGNVKLVVYDIQGREVQTLVNERLQPGKYEVTFDGSALSSGVYFYKLISGSFSETKRMLLIK